LSETISKTVELPGFDSSIRTKVLNKLMDEVKNVEDLATISMFFSAAGAVWQNSFADGTVTLTTSQ
jgi:hypothetical protein